MIMRNNKFLFYSLAMIILLVIGAFSYALQNDQDVHRPSYVHETVIHIEDINSASTYELLEAIGSDDSSYEDNLIKEIKRRFSSSLPQERYEIIGYLTEVAKGEYERQKQLDAMILLFGLRRYELTDEEEKEIVDTLVYVIRSGRNSSIVGSALLVLSGYNATEESFQAVRYRLENTRVSPPDDGWSIIATAYETLGKMGEISVPYLHERINVHPELAAMALASTRTKRALLILKEMYYETEDASMRKHAIQAIGLWWSSLSSTSPEDSPVLEEILVSALNDPDEHVRKKAREWLKDSPDI